MKFRTLMSENVIMSTKYRICITHNAINLNIFMSIISSMLLFERKSYLEVDGSSSRLVERTTSRTEGTCLGPSPARPLPSPWWCGARGPPAPPPGRPDTPQRRGKSLDLMRQGLKGGKASVLRVMRQG